MEEIAYVFVIIVVPLLLVHTTILESRCEAIGMDKNKVMVTILQGVLDTIFGMEILALNVTVPKDNSVSGARIVRVMTPV